MNEIYAAENVGREVVLIRDGAIVGEGYTQTLAYGMISVEMRDERAKALIADSYQVKVWETNFPDKKFKYSLFKFCQFTGEYIDMSRDDPDMECKALESIRIVDKRNLRFGIVPNSFKGVEGYRDAFNEGGIDD